MRFFLLSLAFLMLSFNAFSQVNLQQNIGFEYNNLLNWRCYRNTGALPVSVTYNTNPLTGVNNTFDLLFTGNTYYVAGTGPKVGYVRTTTGAAYDRYAPVRYSTTLQDTFPVPVVCPFPGAGKHSLKLGNDSLSSVCQGVSYNVHIPPGNAKFNIVFYYSIFLQDPSGSHQCWETPFFNVKAFDSTDETQVVPCSDFKVNICDAKTDPVEAANWHISHVATTLPVYYKPWTGVSIIAKNMGGRTLTIRFISSGCSPAFYTYDPGLPPNDSAIGGQGAGSHWGYAYVDFDTTASLYNNDTLRYCPKDTCLKFSPPPGFKEYQVLDSATGNQLAIDSVHAKGATINLSMCGSLMPKPGSKIKLVLYPYTGFTCIDTLTYYIDTFPTHILPPIISPRDSICSGFNMLLINATSGGVWHSDSSNIATVNSSGLFSAINKGFDTVYYAVNNKYGCPDTTYKSLFVVAHSVLPINGRNGVCIGDTIHLSDSTLGGVWSVDNTSIATLTQSGVLSGLSYGVSNVKYVYTNYFGCADSVTKAIQVGIPPLQPIKGSNVLCVKHTDSLSNSTINGTWVSTNTTIATINSTGVVTGVSAGTTTIKYTVSFNGCSDSIKLPVTVNAPVITQITGTTTICQKHTTLLTNASAGGTWISLNPSVAQVNQGLITPGNPGTDTIKYILPISNGCIDSVYTVVTVNHTPVVGAINGPSSACFGVPVTLTDTTAGGKWVSLDTTIIKLNATGDVQYIKAGTVTIRYIVVNSFGCSDSVSKTFTINPIPVVGAITGISSICTGKTSTLSESTVGGVWSSSDNTVVTINGTTVTGVKGGTAVIKYIVQGGGCSDSAIYNITVVDYPVVSAIIGDSVLCLGHPITYTDASANGVWSVVDPSVAVVSNTGTLTPVKLGNSSLYYKVTLPPGCSDSARLDFRVNNFTMNLVSSSTNPVLQTTPVTVNITNPSTPNYTVLNWLPTGDFASITAISQNFIADTTITICAIAKSDAGSCIDTACINIVVTPLNTTVFIPNIIKINANSPENALVKVHTTPKLKALDFRIYNQWGEMIFYTTDINGAWDGKVSGTVQPIGVYVYVARCTTQDDKIINRKGSITLVK